MKYYVVEMCIRDRAWSDVHFKSRRIEKLFQESQEWRLREEAKQNKMIREALQLGEEPNSKKSHVDVKLASTKELLKRLRNHGRRLRRLKEEMSVFREEISSRCHGGDDEGGQDVEGEEGDEVEVEPREHDDEVCSDTAHVIERMNGDDVRKTFDLNSASNVGIYGEVASLQVIVPYVAQQSSMTEYKVDFMKLYRSVEYERVERKPSWYGRGVVGKWP
ncbi:hypothetical protein DEO72_LG8g1832 [Vigna unguiculata]|uniref:Uncharacterized protein n=1 Tax=Vigna unguiculata TaxID=3917 RepID=A0A4D6MV79_VIGUN|nr:hypothetical protein DEO72_LG8g1832 [Vigna unguiculata]